MYIVLKGSVEMSTKDKVVVTIPEGKPFGMISLIDKKLRANTARAKEDCELALLDERTFRVMIEETPGFVWYVINEFVARLRATKPMRCYSPTAAACRALARTSQRQSSRSWRSSWRPSLT